MTGIGTTEGTKETRTTTTNSSANIFPKSRKLSDRGFVKSSKILIGNCMIFQGKRAPDQLETK
uniref:Uncharacterized protein n=1 Tax=Helianthus annuus TaxID=4232 RepID=A0A1Y3BU73_HELAN